jgi:hypothetical protein
MLADINHSPRRYSRHPNHRIVVPDPPEPWTLEEIEWVLWPDTPDHVPPRDQEEGQEEGWPRLLGC